MTIAGFGGQGKTYLAVEAGRWLSQTGMFDTVCFVDYAAFQGVDAVSTAVSEIGCVLEQSFINAAAVTKALSERRTLIILDNLESLAAETLQELLTVAKEWSQVGATRLLLTTRDGGLSHADYPAANSRLHQLLSLSGLGNEWQPEDALRYFQGLMKLPPVPKWDLPERSALIELFKLVDFHPLSIKLVAYQLKERRVGDLARSLEQLLAAEPLGDKDRCLVASLNLSLERLDADLLELLPRLGVFQGGALEYMILKVLPFAPEQWQELKAALLRTGLVRLENIGKLFLGFHPTLAPVLWRRLTAAEQGDLRLRHQQEYCCLLGTLCIEDSKDTEFIRVIARRELANLLWAINGLLDDRSENAVYVVTGVNLFLDYFGLKRDRAFLTERLDRVVGTVGSKNWYFVRINQGEQLYNTGQYQAAANLFAEILQTPDPEQSFDRIKIMIDLGRCLASQGQLSAAASYLGEALLEQSDGGKQDSAAIYINIGIVLTDLGEYFLAQQFYEQSLAISQESGARRNTAGTEMELGTLAMRQGDLATAAQRYQLALEIFQQLEESQSEAKVWYQFGRVYEEGQNWVAADRAYRESARINEQQGNIVEAAQTYDQIAILNQMMQKPSEAEQWFRKALKIDREVRNRLGESRRLYNLACLLEKQLNRLSEAHQLATAALEIDVTLDPAAAKIWSTYSLLARISTAQGETDTAREYRQLERKAKAAFSGTQYELQKYESFIAAVVAAVGDKAAQAELEPNLTQTIENGRGQLVAAIRRVLAGEREVEVLWDDLDLDDSMIIAAILGRV
jgi:tetratricopeptide (TPR) repeat protein